MLCSSQLLILLVLMAQFLWNMVWPQPHLLSLRDVTIHLVTIRFVLRYTACDTLHDTILAIHMSDSSSSNLISRRIHKTNAQHCNNNFTKCIPLAVAREAQRLIELTTADILLYPPLQRSWKRGILVSPCPSVRLSVRPVCPSVDRIVSALYLQQYSSDPFHICTSYQAT